MITNGARGASTIVSTVRSAAGCQPRSAPVAAEKAAKRVRGVDPTAVKVPPA
jgi:hypothetical protein